MNTEDWSTGANLSTYLSEALIRLYTITKLETINNNINTVSGSQRPGNYLFVSIFLLEWIFTKKKSYACCLLLQSLKDPPTQLHHELTCYHNYIGDEGEEAEQDENWGGVCCKVKACRVGGYHN